MRTEDFDTFGDHTVILMRLIHISVGSEEELANKMGNHPVPTGVLAKLPDSCRFGYCGVDKWFSIEITREQYDAIRTRS